MLQPLATISLLLSLLAAQAPTPVGVPAPPGLIDQLVANAEQYRVTLPSLTADESIVSDGKTMGIFKEHAVTTGVFRVIRKTPGGELEESRTLATYNGKAVQPDKHYNLPITLFGGFGRFQEMFFTPEHRMCFDFFLLPDLGPGGTVQIRIEGRELPQPLPGCIAEYARIKGMIAIDAETHQPVHFERTVPDDIAERTRLAPFASVDCAPTKVGEQTYWLPTTVVGHVTDGKVRGEFIARYSNYHRYAASIKVLPGATEVAPEAAPPASTPH